MLFFLFFFLLPVTPPIEAKQHMLPLHPKAVFLLSPFLMAMHAY
jgi:hypothetical protein